MFIITTTLTRVFNQDWGCHQSLLPQESDAWTGPKGWAGVSQAPGGKRPLDAEGTVLGRGPKVRKITWQQLFIKCRGQCRELVREKAEDGGRFLSSWQLLSISELLVLTYWGRGMAFIALSFTASSSYLHPLSWELGAPFTKEAVSFPYPLNLAGLCDLLCLTGILADLI